MAYNHVFFLFLIAFILLATANPLAHGAVPIPSLPGVSLNGQLCCTPTGNCPGQGIPGVNVRLNCTNLLGVTATLGQNTTNANGRFNITVRNLLPGLILPPTGLLPCTASVQLPLNETLCPILSTVNGTLIGVLQGLGPLLTQIIGLVVNATVVGGFNLTI